jgi:acetyltransferase-like isoleucine patch superfamily enzyme
MNKYLRAVICIVYSFIKFHLIKCFHIKRFKFAVCNLVSPFTEIEIGEKATLSLGNKFRMRSGSKIRVRKKADVMIGDNTSLNHGCMIISHDQIHIGSGVQFGPNVLIYDHDHDYRQKDGLRNLLYRTAPIKIGDNVWIGANVVILQGSKIGNNSVIGAGAIIKGEYKDNSVIIQKRVDEIRKIHTSIKSH